MCLLAGVFLGRARQLLGDHELADVDAIAEQVWDHFFGMIHGTLRVPEKTHII